MSDLNEVRAALAGARQVSDTIPVVATMSFDTNGRTMMGVTAAQAAQELGRWGLFAAGANCGNNLADTEAAVQAMHQAGPQLRLVSKANAGIPRWEGADLIYDGTPVVMAAHAQRARAAGARLIGACCGSTAAHLQAMAAALAQPILTADQLPAPAGNAGATNGQHHPPARKRKRRHHRTGER
jgi:5-methyltetrahydrofolate--homocysteine methyltransferase